MFDPSKVMLNEEENNNSSNKKNLQENDKQVKKEKNKTEIEKIDVLGNLEIEGKKEEKIDEEKVENKEKKSKIVFDVNIKKQEDILFFLANKNENYDFVTFEPDEEKVKITFRKKESEAKIKYIKYNLYLNILMKIKAQTKLELEETEKNQEGKGNIEYEGNTYEMISKVVPSNFGENLFFKITKKGVSKKTLEKQKKNNIGQMFTFLGAVFFILLVVGGGILSFIVVNAKTVADVKFFESLGVNLNQVNNLIGSIVFAIFSILTFVLVISLIIFLFKFLLTKKQFKKERSKYLILSILLFILTFSTASAWMYVDRKVRDLPEWGERVRGDIQLFDNAKLKSSKFDENSAFLQKKDLTNGLIGPLQIKFNADVLKSKEAQDGRNIKEYHWTFNNPDGEQEIIETSSEIIKDFNTRGITKVSLSVVETDSLGNETKKEIDNINSINIKYIVDITEIPQETGGKLVKLDAKSLKSKGNPKWYTMDNLESPISENYVYTTDKPIYEETLVGLALVKNGEEVKNLDKIFILKGIEKSNLDAKINYEADKLEDLKYTFKATDIKLDKGTGMIKNFKWKIGEKEYSKKGIYGELEKSSEIEHIFKKYGEKEIILQITNSNGDTKIIKEKIDIKKTTHLKEGLQIFSDGEEIKDINYNSKLGEYNLKDLGIPTKLTFKTDRVKLENILYYLENVSWDLDGNGDIDENGTDFEKSLYSIGRTQITVIYTFKNRKLDGDKKTIKENIYINTIEKDANMTFKIEKDSEYVPVEVGFDASLSKIKGKNIAKFIWDFGDGVRKEGDSVIPGHLYTKAGDYTIKLETIAEDGSSYSIEKKLILKPTPQKVEISSTLKKAPIGQGIDFSSSNSLGDIVYYEWNFGDNTTSSLANPSHIYKKPGKYKITLKVRFRDNNIASKTSEVEIY